MKLLFDQNLSPRLVRSLVDAFPGSAHVRDLGLASADDVTVWSYAAENGFAIASKDADFHQRSFVFGPPPKVVWVRRGNCTTADIERILRDHAAALAAFESDAEAAFIELA